MKQVSESVIYYGMMVENEISRSRFYAAIPGSKIVEVTEDGKKTLYKHIDRDQAIEYVATGAFLEREGNKYWKEALEKWGVENFKFHYYPDDYETEDEFFAKYVDHIINNMYKYTALHCYNIEFSEFEEKLLKVYLSKVESGRDIDWSKVTDAVIAHAGLGGGDDWDDELEALSEKFDKENEKEEKAQRIQESLIAGGSNGGKKKGKKNASKPISIKNIETGEVKVFTSKDECMKFLGCTERPFNKFLKGQSKFNKIYEVL